MTFEEFHAQFEAFWEEINREGDWRKDSQFVLDRLNALYRRADSEEQRMLQEILIGWVSSEDERKRFDAQAIIDRNEIREALPALRAFSEELKSHTDPGAPFERRKIQRIMERLLTSSATGHA